MGNGQVDYLRDRDRRWCHSINYGSEVIKVLHRILNMALLYYILAANLCPKTSNKQDTSFLAVNGQDRDYAFPYLRITA